MHRLSSTLILLGLMFINASMLLAQWVQTEGIYNNNATCLAVSGDKLFAGIVEGGVYVSTNSGRSWTAANEGLTTTTIRDFVSFPADGAAGDTSLLVATDKGIFLSTNEGTSWTAANSGLPSTGVYCDVSALGVSSGAGGNDSTILFAGLWDHGVFLSTNGGASWFAANSGLTNSHVSAFLVSGTNVFAGTSGGGVFLSTNDGTSWTAVNSGLTNSWVNSLVGSDTNIFAGTNYGGVFRSTNGGTNWTSLCPGSNCPRYISDMILSLGVGGKTTLFAGGIGSGVWLSTDCGGSWTAVDSGLATYSISSLAVLGTDLFAGTDGSGWGVFRSSNSGLYWTAVNSGLRRAGASALLVSSSGNGTDDTHLFAGRDNMGVSLSTNGGAGWMDVVTGLSGTRVYALAKNGQSLFAGLHVGGVYRSTDGGVNWVGTSLMADYMNTPVYALAVSAGDGWTNLFAGSKGRGVFLSTDDGTTWSAVNSGLTSMTVNALTVSQSGGGGTDLFAGTDDGVFLSTNCGASWSAVNSGLMTTKVLALAASPNGAGGRDLFAGTSGGGVFRSSDRGTSWSAASVGLTNTDVRALAVSDTTVFAGTWGGAFLSSNNGGTWEHLGGLVTNQVYSLAVSNTDLYAGTNMGGVSRRALSSLTSVERIAVPLPVSCALFQNYPNPFNAGTVIGFRVSGVGYREVRLVVYDVLGREIKTLMDEQKPAGTYQVEFDGSNLSSGVYIYRLSAGDYVESKRMILLR